MLTAIAIMWVLMNKQQNATAEMWRDAEVVAAWATLAVTAPPPVTPQGAGVGAYAPRIVLVVAVSRAAWIMSPTATPAMGPHKC